MREETSSGAAEGSNGFILSCTVPRPPIARDESRREGKVCQGVTLGSRCLYDSLHDNRFLLRAR